MNAINIRYYPALIVSVFLAFIFSIIPLPQSLIFCRPPFLALVILFWALYFPHRSGMGLAFIAGLLFDQLMGTLLGQHAIALVLIAALMRTTMVSMRLFLMWQQMLAVFGYLLLYVCINILIQGLTSTVVFTLWFWLPAAIGALCWPLVVRLLKPSLGKNAFIMNQDIV